MTTESTPDQRPDEPGEHAGHAPGRRPFGFWLKLVDRRLADELDRTLAADGLSRGDWRTLNLLAGLADDEHRTARLLARPELLDRLVLRGWVEPFDEGAELPTLTDEGRAARDRLEASVEGLRARIAGAVPADDFATTLRTLEAVARELGWDETQPMPRGHRGGRRGPDGHRHGGGSSQGGWHGRGYGRRGFGDGGPHGTGREFEHGHGHGVDHEAGHGHHGAPHPHDDGHGHGGHGHGHHGPQQDVHVHVHIHDGRDAHSGHGRKHRPHGKG
ncbi:MarR family winged helix-turn-helix transcriptional regulator [Agromyces sp. MMS24-JH15]|uniref:MarR family winged helix-turn-helix transcriptional regulator n=1 Tax=Agromyces sp. MMS24-JH15 TaxID=3243765 RepID=UPI003748709F